MDNVSRILIVGGGLAGMATAVGLASAGVPVTLLEAGRRLGGRASSFVYAETGEEIDNCQHVVLGCCTNILDFYRRLGVEQLVRRERAIHFVKPGGRQFDLQAVGGLPAPLHLGPAMAAFGLLTLRERAAVSRGMLAMMRLGRLGRDGLLDTPFGDWLDQHRQPASLVTKLYEPILIGALNDDVRKVSAAYAIQVFQDSLLAHADGYVLGLPTCPLSQLYGLMPSIDVRFGQRVRKLRFGDDRGTVLGVDTDDGPIDADLLVLATNHHAVQKWVPTDVAAVDGRFAGLSQLESVPILGVHLVFDRPVLPPGMTHAAFVSGPLQWIFRKDYAGCIVAGVISAARDWHQKPKHESLVMFERQVRETLPLAREAKLLRGVIVIEKRATFSPLPGIDRIRPSQSPPAHGVANLFLAGDYTRTGWPATMEGAVRSGYLAAQAVLARLGRAVKLVVDDLPPQWPARVLARRVKHLS